MDAGRICDGLRRIGYTPPAAIADIVDNSVTAGAKHIYLHIVREQQVSDSRKDNVKAYEVVDDGRGMDEEGIKKALQLGSPNDEYATDTLSKFGLGLKSASFSQGETLEIISSDGASEFVKYQVSLPVIRDREEYGAERLELSDHDRSLIEVHLPDNHGTIVRIIDVRKGNHPSIKSTLEESRERAGIIYYYFMRDSGLKIVLDGHTCTALDALFTDEADANGNLNENEWDGRETRWIQHDFPITLDAERNVKARVEVTQLPHPPTFALPPGNPTEQAKIRDKYHIEAGNYGFYVYRNKRLLSWAERFAGTGTPIIPQNNDFFAFRGRILLDSSADDVINLDVKKSHIMLSEEAYKALSDASAAYKRKSGNAWKRAGAEKTRIENEDVVGTSNRIVQNVEPLDDIVGDADTAEAYEETAEREREIIQEQEKRFEEEVKQLVQTRDSAEDEEGDSVGEAEPIEVQEVITGGRPESTFRIFHVTSTEDHTLWEPYYDAERGKCVRINERHRFGQTLYQDNSRNADLQVLFDLFLLQLAEAEVHSQTKLTKYPRTQVEEILSAFRRYASEFLAHLSREGSDQLPHD